MKYIIWGAGDYGERLLFWLSTENIVAFIDSNPEKSGKEFHGKKVISYEMYKEKYSNYCIIVSTHESEIVKILESDNKKIYFKLSDCPDEFRSSNLSYDLKKYICSRVEGGKTYVIYGKSLFSIIVYEWINEKGSVQPYLLLSKDIDDAIIEDVKNEYGDQVIVAEDLTKYSVDYIYCTDKKNGEENLPFYDGKIENILDSFYSTDIYYNPKIEKFKKLYLGKRCFIVATGPSLTVRDIEVLRAHKEICISMNHIYHIFADTAWRPQFYVADDFRMMRDYPNAMDCMENSYSFIGDGYKPFCEKKHRDNVLIHHVATALSEQELPLFSEDYSRMCYGGGTVTYSCVQLAVYMGFEEIYLLGVDFSYAGKSEEKYTHFYEEGELTSISRTESVQLAYEAAKKYADSHGIKIYNRSEEHTSELQSHPV